MERLRNWYKIHIVPVLPCLRMNRRDGFYKKAPIIGMTSFRQNYEAYLKTSFGAELEPTPLYYGEAAYSFSTLVYHVLDLLSLRGSGRKSVWKVPGSQGKHCCRTGSHHGIRRLRWGCVGMAWGITGVLCTGCLFLLL